MRIVSLSFEGYCIFKCNKISVLVAVSERGCFSQISLAGQAKCAAKDDQCQKCSGQLCNNVGRRDFKCIQCIGSDVSKPI